MSLRTKVKVGNITNLSDARYCAGMGVDLLGFRISETSGQISSVKFKEITDWISGPEFILELSEIPSIPTPQIEGISFIEIPSSEISNFQTAKLTQDLIVSISILDWRGYKDELLRSKTPIKYLLVNDLSAMSRSEAKKNIAEIATAFPVLLGGEMKVELLEEYLSWPIEGLALNGSDEMSPGVKDYDHLSSILEILEVD